MLIYPYLRIIPILAALCIWPAAVVHAADDPGKEPATPTSSLADEIQSLKKEVLNVNRDLFMIEEDILYPESTQVTVFVSLDIGDFFDLDSVQLRVDDKIVSNYLYTNREVAALKRGGVQQLYQGNLKSGDHEITAFLIGKGPHNRNYKRGVTRTITKALSPLFVELKIVDDTERQQPDFDLAVWDH